MWMMATALAGSPCETPVDTDTLAERLEAAREAWMLLEVETFGYATEDLRAASECLTESIDRRTAAEIHRLLGLRAFMEREKDHAVQSFIAANRAEPGYRFPVDMVPSGNPAWKWYAEAAASRPPITPIEPPGKGHIEIDGRPSLAFSTEIPAVVQLFDSDGEVLESRYVAPGAALPTYEPAAAGAKLGVRYDAKVIPVHVPLAIGAGVLGAAGVGLYGAGVVSRARFASESDPPPFETLPTLKSRANTFSTAGVALGGAALALGTSAWLTRRF